MLALAVGRIQQKKHRLMRKPATQAPISIDMLYDSIKMLIYKKEKLTQAGGG